MTRKQGEPCDSCGRIVDMLFPLKLLQETSWGYEMAIRWYCLLCYSKTADRIEEMEEPDEPKPDCFGNWLEHHKKYPEECEECPWQTHCLEEWLERRFE